MNIENRSSHGAYQGKEPYFKYAKGIAVPYLIINFVPAFNTIREKTLHILASPAFDIVKDIRIAVSIQVCSLRGDFLEELRGTIETIYLVKID